MHSPCLAISEPRPLFQFWGESGAELGVDSSGSTSYHVSEKRISPPGENSGNGCIGGSARGAYAFRGVVCLSRISTCVPRGRYRTALKRKGTSCSRDGQPWCEPEGSARVGRPSRALGHIGSDAVPVSARRDLHTCSYLYSSAATCIAVRRAAFRSLDREASWRAPKAPGLCVER